MGKPRPLCSLDQGKGEKKERKKKGKKDETNGIELQRKTEKKIAGNRKRHEGD